MLNRAQRRSYDKFIKNVKNSDICPICGQLTRFYSYDYSLDKDNPNIVLRCERCDATVRSGPELKKLVPKGIYLPFTLAVLDKAIQYEIEHPEEESKNDEGNTD